MVVGGSLSDAVAQPYYHPLPGAIMPARRLTIMVLRLGVITRSLRRLM
jgi:hypothetical protein